MNQFSFINEKMAEALARHMDETSLIGTAIAAEARVSKFAHNGIALNVSREMALDLGVVEPTPEEAARREVERQQWAETRRMGHEQTLAYVAALDAIDDPLTRQLLDLHDCERTGTYPDCEGCETGSYAESGIEWPCGTVDLIADHYAIERPIFIAFEEQK